MVNKIIADVTITPLKQISDERGAVFHFLKSDSANFKGFGEIYFSKINEGVVKGWKFHKNTYQNFCVPFGSVKFVVFDNRPDSLTKGVYQEFLLNQNDNFSLLSLPPCLWYSFKSISMPYSLIANLIDLQHTTCESINLPLINDTIDYIWK